MEMTHAGEIRALVVQKCQTVNATKTRKPVASSGEPVKLHKAGGIKNEPDASFYAKLVKRFGASFGNETSKQGGNRSKRET